MPSAGAVVPPTILPIRRQTPGVPSTHIDTATYIELDSETPGSKVYFSTDGSKPNPFQLKVAGRECTFRYKGPFTLKTGKRTLKTIAVSRDGLQESNVNTKTFNVDDVGEPGEYDEDCDNMMDIESVDSYRPMDSYRSTGTGRRPLSGRTGVKTTKKKRTMRSSMNSTRPAEPVEAWASTTPLPQTAYVPNGVNTSTNYGVSTSLNGLDPSSMVQIPEGPFNPTNYSGTQMNFWGAAPNTMPGVGGSGGYSLPYGSTPSQLGYMTNNMLRKLDTQPRTMTIADLRQMIADEATRHQPPPQPAITYPQEPELKPTSPGGGDWKAQLEHIHAHLLEQCKKDIGFRRDVGDPPLGKIVRAEFAEEDHTYLLTVSLLKPGHPVPSRTKPKPKPTPPPPSPQPKPPVKKPVKKDPEPPKPKPKPKQEPKPKPKADPYFETEEYEPKKTPPQPLSPRGESQSGRKPKGSPPRSGRSSGRSSVRSSARSSARSSGRKPRPPVLTSSSESEEEEDSETESEEERDPIYEQYPTDPYYRTEDYKQEGTLKPWPTFSAEIDCERLRKAMKGIGTDERTIIDIMGYRASVQRQEVMKMFKTMFGKDLREELKGELSGDFKECVKALCMAPDEYDASEIRKAIKGLGTDEDCLIEILCTRTNAQIKAMNAAYEKLYNKEMVKDVKGDTSFGLKQLLVAQCQGNRDESPTFDRTEAQSDAQRLFDAGEKKWGTDESTFNQILCQRSYAHLRAVFEEYEKLSKKAMEDVIKSEFSGDVMQGYLTVVRCIKEKPAYFAKKLQKSMKGLGTDDSAMIRIVVSRCESDMVQIMAAFERDYNAPLGQWIKDDCSGDYKEILLALIGVRPPPLATAEEKEEAEGEPELEEIEEEEIEEDPTLVPADPFDPKSDCEVLKKAMKGLGTDETAIINVMARRSNAQRLELVKTYRTMYGKDLVKELKSETSGNFKNCLVALCQAPDDFDANELRKAMKGLGTDEDCLVEIICTRTNAEMAAVIEAYNRLHGRKLEEDIISETSGHLKRLLVSMLQANRPEGNTIDRRKCRKDAKDLFEAGEKKWGTDESRFNVILCSRSFAHLRATFDEYEKLANKDIEDSIKEEVSGDLKKGYLTIVRTVKNKAAQFAQTLQKSMKGLGTKDDSLVRTVITRCEREMVQIKQEFQQRFDGSLGKWIADDTSGDYRSTLLILVAEEDCDKKKRR